MLVQTQNKGKVTVGELASSMGKIIPTANASNVSLEQLCAGYAIMTSKGIAAAETTTYMNSMLKVWKYDRQAIAAEDGRQLCRIDGKW